MPGIEWDKRDVNQDYKQMSLRELADKIRERLLYHISDDLRKECLEVDDIYRAAKIVKDYKNEIGCLLSAFWGRKEDVKTKARLQEEKFGGLLNSYVKTKDPEIMFFDMLLGER